MLSYYVMKENNSIKTAFQLLLFYVCVVIAGTLAAAGVYTVYVLCTHIVAGQGISAFGFKYFISGLLVMSPVVLVLTNLLMCLYLIRHASKGVLPFSVYIVLYALSWLGLIPLMFNVSAKYSLAHANDVEAREYLSTGYFRSVDDKILYYSRILEDNSSDGLVIDLDDPDNSVQTFRNMKVPESHGFLDYLIQSTIEMPPVTSTATRMTSQFMGLASATFRHGYVYWLLFATMGAALLSVYGIKRLSRWRLVNVVMIIFISLCIILFNMLAYSGLYKGSLCYPVVSAVNNFAKALTPVCNPTAVFGNLLCFVVFSTIGTVVHFKRRNEGTEFDE